ncbi:uncharacterized protein LOC117102161 [Anneissia japonica]|uniref:uncharacterized protein LOC117102161 n=1 Tax=Anneissia japonica TaxID=1529436 RepID=UPI00142576C4|nr:uncharacterized protein LOC117102161 [Anneissia japonica]
MMRMLCVLLPILVITQSKYAVAIRCVLKNKTCECTDADIGTTNEDLLLNCKGAKSLVLTDAELSEENWPSGLNLKPTEIVNLTLSSNAFQTIPTNHLPYQLQVLDLSGNIINNISGTPLSCFKELKILDLSYNNISNVDDDVFDGLCGLEELYLKGNSLHYFKNIYSAVRKVPSLIILDLAENLLENVFMPVLLKNLQVFNLRNNTISAVSVDRCTYRLPNLQEIDLRNNNLAAFPVSIVDDFNKTDILLEDNPIECHCHVSIPLMNDECISNETIIKTFNFVQNCTEIRDRHVQTKTDSKFVILSSGSEVSKWNEVDSYCSDETQEEQLRGRVTEICWDVPEDIGLCMESRDLIKVTENGTLNLTLASHYDISGLYSYKEYHICHEWYMYTVTGNVRFKGNTSETQQCSPDYCMEFNHGGPPWFNEPPGLTTLQISFIVFGGCICALAVFAVVLYRIKKLESSGGSRESVERELSTQEPPLCTSANDIDSEVARSQTRISLVVINGYLNYGSSLNIDIQSSDIPQNTAEAIEQGYRSLSIDENGYLIMKPDLGKDLPDDPNGYYSYIPNKSANKVLVDVDGYLCVNPPVRPITEDGYTFMILRKDQGALGQLTMQKNKYIQLQLTKRHTEENHIYSKIQTTWQLLRFWENQEQKHSNEG